MSIFFIFFIYKQKLYQNILGRAITQCLAELFCEFPSFLIDFYIKIFSIKYLSCHLLKIA
jgi:hypothetical protein